MCGVHIFHCVWCNILMNLGNGQHTNEYCCIIPRVQKNSHEILYSVNTIRCSTMLKLHVHAFKDIHRPSGCEVGCMTTKFSEDILMVHPLSPLNIDPIKFLPLCVADCTCMTLSWSPTVGDDLVSPVISGACGSPTVSTFDTACSCFLHLYRFHRFVAFHTFH